MTILHALTPLASPIGHLLLGSSLLRRHPHRWHFLLHRAHLVSFPSRPLRRQAPNAPQVATSPSRFRAAFD